MKPHLAAPVSRSCRAGNGAALGAGQHHRSRRCRPAPGDCHLLPAVPGAGWGPSAWVCSREEAACAGRSWQGCALRAKLLITRAALRCNLRRTQQTRLISGRGQI